MKFLLAILCSLPLWSYATEPTQVMLDAPFVVQDSSDYKIYAVAQFSLTGLVLSKEHYWFDKESKFSSYDVAMGWDLMENPTILSKMEISQSNRFYWWKTKDAGLYAIKDKIISNSTNIHLVASNKEVAKQIEKIKKNQTVELKGYLVNIKMTNGWRWNSSLSRTDTGAGACELMWVTSIE